MVKRFWVVCVRYISALCEKWWYTMLSACLSCRIKINGIVSICAINLGARYSYYSYYTSYENIGLYRLYTMIILSLLMPKVSFW